MHEIASDALEGCTAVERSKQKPPPGNETPRRRHVAPAKND